MECYGARWGIGTLVLLPLVGNLRQTPFGHFEMCRFLIWLTHLLCTANELLRFHYPIHFCPQVLRPMHLKRGKVNSPTFNSAWSDISVFPANPFRLQNVPTTGVARGDYAPPPQMLCTISCTIERMGGA